jgi:YegS/Rv2252/BmrU family lipid kinase
MKPHKPIHLIINPRSGYGSQKFLLPEFRNELKQGGYHWVEYVTRSVGDATRRVRDIRKEAGAVVAWGGDGTVNEIANALAGWDVPLLVTPAGTENLLAKELRMPRHPKELAGLLKDGRKMPCDLGVINGQTFHSILGVGFDAEVVRRLSVNRTGHISHLSYFWPIWRTFWEHDFPQMRIDADGEKVFSGRGLAFVGNISRYATGLRVCRDAKFDDGLLDLVVFECHAQVSLVLHAAWTLLRRHPLKGNVIYRPARQIRIETEKPMECEMDGDVGPRSPLDISVSPDRIQLIVPSRPNRWTLPMWPWKGAPL